MLFWQNVSAGQSDVFLHGTGSGLAPGTGMHCPLEQKSCSPGQSALRVHLAGKLFGAELLAGAGIGGPDALAAQCPCTQA